MHTFLPSSHLRRGAAALALTAVTLLAAPGCSSDEDPPAKTTTSTTKADQQATDPTTTTTEAPDTEGSTDEEGASTSGGAVAEWANEFETPGDKLTSIEGEGFRVDIYQVGTTKAPEDGNFVDPDTKESILQEGDEIVFVNYVFTNTGKEPIPLSHSLVDVNATYADWEWAQGMDTVSDRSLFEEMGVLATAITPGGDAPFIWEPGTTFAVGDNFKYQPGSAITFNARLTPSDDEGDLVHDERQEIEAETKIS